ncbi:hypothetical protein SKAU_G00315130 [Synaphobranchus kaupii]|uniref:Doublecortin domain-containing protein n=1 Tax=Synaphobranchus kaupii TaxID=118154 RepID=A0A9Q1IJI8_SYNKA|nr:hypothetical protein SKAU_G00315130 [Synaphobranchus kaupii]
MAGERSSSASTLRSGTSRRSSWTQSSLSSSLEEALVREYSDRFSTTSSSASDPHLPRKYISPYASKGSRNSGNTRRSALLTPDPSPPSSASTRKGWRRRPHSSPSPHLRRSRPSSRTSPPVYERQPAVIRVTAHKNGFGQASTKITAPSFTMLLEECTSKLKLVSAARRIFLEDGREVSRSEDIPKDADVYISSGEAFQDPREEMRGRGGAVGEGKKRGPAAATLRAARAEAEKQMFTGLRLSWEIMRLMRGASSDSFV